MSETETYEHRYQILLTVLRMQECDPAISTDALVCACAKIFQNILTAHKMIEEKK